MELTYSVTKTLKKKSTIPGHGLAAEHGWVIFFDVESFTLYDGQFGRVSLERMILYLTPSPHSFAEHPVHSKTQGKV